MDKAEIDKAGIDQADLDSDDASIDAYIDASIDTAAVSAEIEAEADKQRRQDREIALLELEIEQAWADLSPSESSEGSRSSFDAVFNAVGGNGHLLDEAAALAALDPHVPVGSRRGLRSIKWAVRKLSYWYVRFLTDQFNLFAGVLIRHLRNLEARLGRLEAAAGFPDLQPVPAEWGVLDDPPEPSAEVVAHVAGLAAAGPCLVLSTGQGALVKAIGDRGVAAYGVEQDPQRALVGLQRGIDIRAGDVLAHLTGAQDGEFGAIVLAGTVENLPLKDLIGIIDQAGLKLNKAGRIVVAVASPTARGRVESELGAGLGISPATWQHLLERAGFNARLEPCADARISEIVVGCRPAHPGAGPSGPPSSP